MTLAGRPTDTGAHSLARYRDEFPIFRGGIYLNTCSLGALGDRTRRRVAEFLDVWQRRGASAWYDVWWGALGELRARYARVVNASPAEIALAPSISVALSAVAEALDYGRRPRVVVTSLDFPTVAYQWLAQRPRGVELVVVESPGRASVPVHAAATAGAGPRRSPAGPATRTSSRSTRAPCSCTTTHAASSSAPRRWRRCTPSSVVSTTSRRSGSRRSAGWPPSSPKT